MGAYLPYWANKKSFHRTEKYHFVNVSGGDQIGLWIPDDSSSKPDSSQGNNAEVLDSPVETSNSNNPVVLLVHGLGGGAFSPYVRRMADLVFSKGWTPVRMEMRGVGLAGKNASALYHTGRSDDLMIALNFLRNRFPNRPIALAGFSLGAAISLHLLTRRATEASTLLKAAGIISPPLELARCTKGIQTGFNRVYDWSFAKSLWKILRQRKEVWKRHRQQLPETPPKTLWAFDHQVTAPLGGFQSAEDYYSQCSSFDVVNQIPVSTLVLAAADDPIVPAASIENASWNNHSQVEVSLGGGHLGFVGKGGKPGFRWMESRLMDFLSDQLSA